MADKLPYFPFFPKDWLGDKDLARCSLAAQGLWIRMIAMMWDCEQRGRFITSDKPWTIEEISGAVPGDITQNVALLHELLSKGVARIDKRNVIFSARMVRDEQIRQLRAKSGSQGGSARVRNLLEQNAKQNPSKPSSKRQAKPQAKHKQIPEICVYVNENEIEGKGGAGEEPSKTLPIPFETSPVFSRTAFALALPDWPKEKISHYHAQAVASSNRGNRYIDWIVTVRNWDEQQPGQWNKRNGKSPPGNGKKLAVGSHTAQTEKMRPDWAVCGECHRSFKWNRPLERWVSDCSCFPKIVEATKFLENQAQGLRHDPNESV